jgi:ABC-2 type transport system permease protein
MPILDQGYQHWQGKLAGHAGRWLTVARQGVRAQLKNRWVWFVILAAWLPALILSGFLVLWGLFEQKSSLLTPIFFFFQGLPEELKAGPRGFRTEFWTIAFNQFFDVELFFSMLLVLLVGPDLISQDLRFNAIPLYLSRPVRRIDYFAGKLGVIAFFLSAVTIVPILLAFALGYGFSLDPMIVRDTWRILVASLAFGAIIVGSAGTLMLAISSLSRNSRYVGAMWVGIWVVSGVASGVLNQTIRQDWCPLISYTGNLNRVREALIDSETAWGKISGLFQTGQDKIRDAAGQELSGRRRRGRFGFNFGPAPPAPPAPPAAPSASHSHIGNDRSTGKIASYPWQWSAGVLAGLAGLSVWILATRVRSLDRLR